MKLNVLYQHTIMLISILIFPGRILQCQLCDKNVPVDYLQEKVVLFTDRDIYCVGESLFFRAYNLSNRQLKSANWSTVLYIELITPEGKPVLQHKYSYDSTGSSGNLIIPEDILTGNYYLRAYTKWMRNFSAYRYYYQVIKIINPYQAELLKFRSGLTLINENPSPDTIKDCGWHVETDKQVYQKREKVVLTAGNTGNKNKLSDCCITVVRTGLVKRYSFPLAPVKDDQFQPDYIPETRSLTLTGKVISRKDSSPIPSVPVSLSVLNSTKNTLVTLTDENGCFYFSLAEMTGETEVYISTLHPNGESEPDILVHNDFCSKEVSLPFVRLSQDSSARNIYNELIFNTQVSNKYHVVEDKGKKHNPADTVPFYGIPSQKLYLDDFIALPSIEDYFNEFIPNVVIRKKNREKYFQILGLYSDLHIHKPLVMVDYVAVQNVNWILSVSPGKVDRIEVIDKPYVTGDICYGGIIHIVSLDGDFAGVDLPSSGKFFKFKMLSSGHSFHFQKPENPRIPDLRNLLYWKPMVKLKNEQSGTHVFYTGDTTGEYMAIIRGVDKLGNEISNWCTFTVR